MRKILIIFVLCIIGFIALANEGERQLSLEGLGGIEVFIGSLTSIGQEYSEYVVIKSIENNTKVQLRQFGIKILTEKQALQTLGRPLLFIKIGLIEAAPEGDDYVVGHIGISLVQTVQLHRKPTIRCFALTWRESLMFRSNISDIHDDIEKYVRDLVNVFINDYLAVNEIEK